MKRNYPLIHCDGLMHSSEYYKNQDYQDSYLGGEKIVHPSYIDSEQEIYNRCVINYFLTALNLLKNGRALSELIWQDFRNLIKEWFLRKEGWTISKNNNQKNHSRFLVAQKMISTIGEVNCIWLTKKYSIKRKVGVEAVEELEHFINKANVSKGCIVTTSKLTKPAINLINKNSFRMFYIDNELLERELISYNTQE